MLDPVARQFYDSVVIQDEDGYKLHSKDSGVTWDSLNYSIRYHDSGTNGNVLHMTIDISWPSTKAENDYTIKMQNCVKKCVSEAFGVHFDKNGYDAHAHTREKLIVLTYVCTSFLQN